MNKIKTNFIFNTAYQILILIIPLITTPYIARVLGPNGVGEYSYTYSIVSYFMMFAVLGIGTYGNREIAKVHDNKDEVSVKFYEIFYCQLIISIIVTIIYYIYILLFNKQFYILNLIQSVYLISTIFDINWFFCGLQKFKFLVTRNIVIRVIAFICTFIFVKYESDLWKYVLLLGVSTLATQLSLWPFLKKEIVKKKVKFIEIKKHFKPIIILFIPTIAMSVYRVMDKIMVGNIINVEEVGYYEYAEKLLNIILSVVSALVTVTMPEMTYLHKKGEYEKFYNIFNKSVVFIYFLVIPVIYAFWAVGDNLVNIYLGTEFTKTSLLLKILSFSLLFSPISSIIRNQIFIPKCKDKEYIISIILGAVINLLLNFILIYKIDSIGAAISTNFAEFIVFFMQYMYIRKEIDFLTIFKRIIYFIVTGLVMFIIVINIKDVSDNIIINLVLKSSVGVISYGVLNYKFILDNFKFIKNK